MGQEETVPATVVFSWEHEPAKLSPWTRKAASTAGDMPDSPRKAPAPAPARRLSVPPPPGRASTPATRSLSFSRARAVRPEDDPFLAAYLACTKSTKTGGGAREGKAWRRFTWARLGLSCKSSNGVVEESMVRLSKLPEVHPSDA